MFQKRKKKKIQVGLFNKRRQLWMISDNNENDVHYPFVVFFKNVQPENRV